MVEDGITTVVMEVSSQALEQAASGRDHLRGCRVYQSFARAFGLSWGYGAILCLKAKIFSQCRCAVINTADPYGRRLLDRANADLRLPPAVAIPLRTGQEHSSVGGGQLIVPLTGEVFLPDALAAAETALVLGLTSRQVMAAMPQCPPYRAEPNCCGKAWGEPSCGTMPTPRCAGTHPVQPAAGA